MRFISGLRIEARNFRSFLGEAKIDQIMPINVVIGRNNSGKSALVDLLSCVFQPAEEGSAHFDKSATKSTDTKHTSSVLFTLSISQSVLSQFFSEPFPKQPGLQERLGTIADRVSFKYQRSTGSVVVHAGYEGDSSYFDDYFRQFAVPQILQRVIGAHRIFRIRADRDILPEPIQVSDLQGDGKNATSFIARHLTQEGMNRNLVRESLLDDLNKILRPDASFVEIFPQQRSNGPWEIFLRDTSQREIALSEMGSGLKTVLLVILAMRVMPSNDIPTRQWVFAFEELENNVHPAMLRRLLSYITVRNEDLKSTLIITTHSPVMLDILARRDDTQVLHVTHDGNCSSVRRHEAGALDRSLLEDIGARPSDLLLTNAVIWVEGPSDRLYIRKWIDLWSDGKLQEGTHYQVVIYGGSIVAHYSFAASVSPEELAQEQKSDTEALIRAVRINHNAIVLMDSDKDSDSDSLKDNVARIQQEALASGAIAWVTKGREVENYIPDEATNAVFGGLPLKETSFHSYFEHLANNGKGKAWQERKVPLAKKICPILTKEQLEGSLDLAARLDEVCAKLREWNGIAANS